MALTVALVLSLCLSCILAAPANKTVNVGYYAESLCPDCIALSTKYMDKAVNEVSIAGLTRLIFYLFTGDLVDAFVLFCFVLFFYRCFSFLI